MSVCVCARHTHVMFTFKAEHLADRAGSVVVVVVTRADRAPDAINVNIHHAVQLSAVAEPNPQICA